jgi:hypothetical protein
LSSDLQQLRQLEELIAVRPLNQYVFVLRLLLGNRSFYFLDIVEQLALDS